MADYMELFLRLDSLSQNNYQQEISPKISISRDTDWEDKKNSLSQDQTISSSPDSSIQYVAAAQTLKEYLQMISTIERGVQIMMHQKIDSLQPINYTQYKNFLQIELQKKGIATPFVLQVIRRGAADSIVYTGGDLLYKKQPWKNTVCFTHTIEPEQYYYSLRLPSPDRIVFRQMAGILISSFLLVVIILIAFIYLLYTII